MHVLIPCKNLNTSKSRLANYLEAGARRAFCEQLLTQSLKLAMALVAPTLIRVATSDDDAIAIADRYGIAALPDPGCGLNAALELARATVLGERADAILTLPIDLPFATPEAIAKVVDCAGEVVIGPDQSGTGTNLLLLRGAALRRLPFAFGPGSCAAHLAAAQADGIDVEIVRDERIAFDIDEPAQYAAWLNRIVPRVHSAAG